MFKKIIVVLVLCLFVMSGAIVSAQTRVILDTGDPAERVCNPKSYTDLGNGIVRDNVTGLEWQKATAPGTYDWQQALNYCNSLSLGGRSDWRLPSIEELSTLVDAGRYDPAINTTYFPNTVAYCYWSSTTSCFTNWKWVVDFYYGEVTYEFESLSYSVRAVRGGPLQAANKFVDNDNGTVTDTSTGLMWQKATASGAYTWYEALDYCSSLSLGGHSDWRLPTRNELQSLVDYSRCEPATTFPNTVVDSYWSSTIDAADTVMAWDVGFYYGFVSWFYKSHSTDYVRAVRGGPCEAIGECLNDTDCEDDSLYCTGAPTCADGECGFAVGPCAGDTPSCDEVNDRCVECLGDTDCEAGMTCQDGVCIEQGGNQCKNDIDCQDDQYCYVNGTCVPSILPLSINTHWYNWAGDFDLYREEIKKFRFVRDHAWWVGLEESDLTTDSAWNNAKWKYSYHQDIKNCNQQLTYESGYDELVRKFQSPDSPELLLTLEVTNAKLSSDPNSITYEQYYDYVYHVVERYDGDGFMDMPDLVNPVRYFEIGNEVDNSIFNAGLTLENYVDKRLIPGYLAAKAANSNAFILNSGLYMGGDGKKFDTKYLSKMLARIKKQGGGGKGYYMDGFAFHYYFDPQNPEYFEKNYPKATKLLQKYALSQKPVWITEYGMATKNDPGGEIREEDQASVLLRFSALMKYYGISEGFIYNLKDENSAVPADWENVYGLYKVECHGTTEDVQEKEAVNALTIFAQKIYGLNQIMINPSTERKKGIYRVTFASAEKKVQILWYTEFDKTGINPDYSNETMNIAVSLDGKTGILSSMDGTVVDAKLSDKANIVIGEQPVYIEY